MRQLLPRELVATHLARCSSGVSICTFVLAKQATPVTGPCGAPGASPDVSICTFVLVKQVNCHSPGSCEAPGASPGHSAARAASCGQEAADRARRGRRWCWARERGSCLDLRGSSCVSICAFVPVTQVNSREWQESEAVASEVQRGEISQLSERVRQPF